MNTLNDLAKKQLTIGLVVIALVLGYLYQFQKNRIHQLPAEEASVKAESFLVGLDFTGVITEQQVTKGDFVQAGDVLFHVKSNTLVERINEDKIKASELFYPLNDKNEIILKAPRSGYVISVDYSLGSFVSANSELAKIVDTSSLHVVSSYLLKENELTRLAETESVLINFPDGHTERSAINTISVEKRDKDQGRFFVTVESSYDTPAKKDIVIQNTPVKADLVFRQPASASTGLAHSFKKVSLAVANSINGFVGYLKGLL